MRYVHQKRNSYNFHHDNQNREPYNFHNGHQKRQPRRAFHNQPPIMKKLKQQFKIEKRNMRLDQDYIKTLKNLMLQLLGR